MTDGKVLVVEIDVVGNVYESGLVAWVAGHEPRNALSLVDSEQLADC